MGDRWTLLIVLALSDETLRLSVLRARLPGVSSGVLDHHLSQMTTLGLISRQRFREMPPRVEVALTEAGSELLPIAAALARWGMRYEWPLPPSREYVPAGAVLRQLPALLEERNDLPNGTLEAVIGDGEERAVHCFEIVEGRLRASSTPPAKVTARLEGDDDAWIAALGPGRDYSGLHLAGKQRMAQRILDSLPRGEMPVVDEVLDGVADGVANGASLHDGAIDDHEVATDRRPSDGHGPERKVSRTQRRRTPTAS
ncbi:MAG TPA: helix-turn-helix domain-containing protein [Solirubrobacteraceae bacterium]|nr:helix-turn-helix domain-containing protein [Solirubrobacteraceae bacterium]